MLECYFYVSACCADPERRADQVGRMVRYARVANERLGLTGALVFSGSCFAQYLEGPVTELRGLINKIAIDPLHERFAPLEVSTISQRQFGGRPLLYSGPSIYFDRQISTLLQTQANDIARRRRSSQLLELILSLSDPVASNRRLLSSYTVLIEKERDGTTV